MAIKSIWFKENSTFTFDIISKNIHKINWSHTDCKTICWPSKIKPCFALVWLKWHSYLDIVTGLNVSHMPLPGMMLSIRIRDRDFYQSRLNSCRSILKCATNLSCLQSELHMLLAKDIITCMQWKTARWWQHLLHLNSHCQIKKNIPDFFLWKVTTSWCHLWLWFPAQESFRIQWVPRRYSE